MKTTTLMIFLAAMSTFNGLAFAGPPPRHPECGPHHYHHHHHPGYRGSDGVRMAADIVGLVGASLNILRGPAVIQPVYTVPVVQPVVQPVYTVPVVQPAYPVRRYYYRY